MKENQAPQKLQIHYYFDDESHSMNAFVRNRAEKDLLEAIKRVGVLLNSELIIETEAYQEGGLKEIIFISGLILSFLSPSINNIITHYFTKDAEVEELDKEIKQKTLKNLQLNNAQKERELKKEIEEKLEDKLVARHVSNYYKKIEAYEKVQKIGFKSHYENSTEYIVERKYFKNFILLDSTTITEDDEAIIEIISPVLKEGKFSWRGKYQGAKIDFSMADSKFKEEVIEGKYTFSNGISLYCNLQITAVYDEFGDEKRRNYSVRKVYGVQEEVIGELKLREVGRKKKRKQHEIEHYHSLFDIDDPER